MTAYLHTHALNTHERTNERGTYSPTHTQTRTHTRSPHAVHPQSIHTQSTHTQSTRSPHGLRRYLIFPCNESAIFLLCKVSLTESRSARSARAAPRQRAEILEEILDCLLAHLQSRRPGNWNRAPRNQVNQAPRNALWSGLSRDAQQLWRPRMAGAGARRSTATPTPTMWRHAGHVRARQSEKALSALCGAWCGRAAVGQRRLHSSVLTCLRCARAPTLHRSNRIFCANWTLVRGSRTSQASRPCLRPSWSPMVLLCAPSASAASTC